MLETQTIPIALNIVAFRTSPSVQSHCLWYIPSIDDCFCIIALIGLLSSCIMEMTGVV